jgi:hypothetical protein
METVLAAIDAYAATWQYGIQRVPKNEVEKAANSMSDSLDSLQLLFRGELRRPAPRAPSMSDSRLERGAAATSRAIKVARITQG